MGQLHSQSVKIGAFESTALAGILGVPLIRSCFSMYYCLIDLDRGIQAAVGFTFSYLRFQLGRHASRPIGNSFVILRPAREFELVRVCDCSTFKAKHGSTACRKQLGPSLAPR